jgi:GT2 family glycosyltransferase
MNSATARPHVDVVVPFRGSQRELQELRARLARLQLGPGDTILVVDNTPGRDRRDLPGPVAVHHAAARSTPGYARNRGAEHGTAEWLVFIDADTDPVPDLLHRYFDPPPAAETVLLAGGVIDELVPISAPAPARYAYLRRTLSQDRTFGAGKWDFAQTANVACRRTAFESVGGFRESIRSGEDADLSYRLKAARGRIERREQAAVVHRNRRTVRAFIAQAALHGAGSAWVNRHYPGSFPARRRPGLMWWAVRTATTGTYRAIRLRNRDHLVHAIFEPLWELSFEFGRSRSIEERAPRRSSANR